MTKDLNEKMFTIEELTNKAGYGLIDEDEFLSGLSREGIDLVLGEYIESRDKDLLIMLTDKDLFSTVRWAEPRRQYVGRYKGQMIYRVYLN